VKSQTIFKLADPTTRDSFAIDFDRKGDRLLVRSAIDNEGARVMVIIDARETGLRLASELLEALRDPIAPRPKRRATKLPRKVAL
jgi:hypothetical protein